MVFLRYEAYNFISFIWVLLFGLRYVVKPRLKCIVPLQSLNSRYFVLKVAKMVTRYTSRNVWCDV